MKKQKRQQIVLKPPPVVVVDGRSNEMQLRAGWKPAEERAFKAIVNHG